MMEYKEDLFTKQPNRRSGAMWIAPLVRVSREVAGMESTNPPIHQPTCDLSHGDQHGHQKQWRDFAYHPAYWTTEIDSEKQVILF